MNNSTLDIFLLALRMFRDNLVKQDMDIMPTIVKMMAGFVADKNNDLLIYTDYEFHPLTIDTEDGEIAFVYTSPREILKAHEKDGNVDYVMNTAFKVFDDISKQKNYSGIIIDDGTKPDVFIPSDIMAHIVECANYINKCS